MSQGSKTNHVQMCLVLIGWSHGISQGCWDRNKGQSRYTSHLGNISELSIILVSISEKRGVELKLLTLAL